MDLKVATDIQVQLGKTTQLHSHQYSKEDALPSCKNVNDDVIWKRSVYYFFSREHRHLTLASQRLPILSDPRSMSLWAEQKSCRLKVKGKKTQRTAYK